MEWTEIKTKKDMPPKEELKEEKSEKRSNEEGKSEKRAKLEEEKRVKLKEEKDDLKTALSFRGGPHDWEDPFPNETPSGRRKGLTDELISRFMYLFNESYIDLIVIALRRNSSCQPKRKRFSNQPSPLLVNHCVGAQLRGDYQRARHI